MKIFPSLNIRDGQCVKLEKGDMSSGRVYEGEPLYWAQKWQDEGADTLLIRDVNAAMTGEFANREIVKEIVHRAKIPVLLSGGVRTRDDVRCRVEEVGVSRVIIGTMAVEDMDFIAWAKSVYGGDRIAVGIDAKDGYVVTRGWAVDTEVDAVELAEKVRKLGIGTVIYTDTLRHGTLSGPNVEKAEQMVKRTWMNILVSGGIKTIEDIKGVRGSGACGAILGTALYEGVLEFSAARKAGK